MDQEPNVGPESPLAPVQANPSPSQPLSTAPEPPIAAPKKNRHKLFYLVIILVLLLVGAWTYISHNKSTPKSQASRSIPKLSLPNQPKQLNAQFSTQDFTAGYVEYKSEDFKKVDMTIPPVVPIEAPAATTSGLNQVVFMNDLSYKGAGHGHRLLMYDVTSKTTYLIDQNSAGGRYDNARIMSNHYVVFVDTTEADPLNSNTAIKFVNLDTGESKIIMTAKASELPASLCCAVTSDGLRMVIPQTGKFEIYQAGELKPTEFSADVQVFPKVEGSGGGDYEAAQRNYGYPAITWLDDDHFMYAKSHPLKWTVDKDGSHAATNNNGLAIFNITTGQSADVQHLGEGPIKWFSVDGKAITFAVYKPNVSGVVDDNSGLTILKINDYTSTDSIATELLGIPLDFQSYLNYDQSSKKLYVQPAGAGLQEDTRQLTILDTTAGTVTKKELPSKFKGPLLTGFIGEGKAVIDDSFSVDNDYYVYNLNTDEAQLIMSASNSR